MTMPSEARRSGLTLRRARRLRRQETEEEAWLWTELRNRRLNGFKFIRQAPIGPYIADFLCRERALVVEVDGYHHADNPKDKLRTQQIAQFGLSVLRFWNHEIIEERRAVLETIVAALECRLQPETGLRFARAGNNHKEEQP